MASNKSETKAVQARLEQAWREAREQLDRMGAVGDVAGPARDQGAQTEPLRQRQLGERAGVR